MKTSVLFKMESCCCGVVIPFNCEFLIKEIFFDSKLTVSVWLVGLFIVKVAKH